MVSWKSLHVKNLIALRLSAYCNELPMSTRNACYVSSLNRRLAKFDVWYVSNFFSHFLDAAYNSTLPLVYIGRFYVF